MKSKRRPAGAGRALRGVRSCLFQLLVQGLVLAEDRGVVNERVDHGAKKDGVLGLLQQIGLSPKDLGQVAVHVHVQLLCGDLIRLISDLRPLNGYEANVFFTVDDQDLLLSLFTHLTSYLRKVLPQLKRRYLFHVFTPIK